MAFETYIERDLKSYLHDTARSGQESDRDRPSLQKGQTRRGQSHGASNSDERASKSDIHLPTLLQFCSQITSAVEHIHSLKVALCPF